MVVRFCLLQGHYSSVLNITNQGLQAAKKAYIQLANGLRTLQRMPYVEDGPTSAPTQADILQGCQQVREALSDDLNTAKAIGHLFGLLKKINALHRGLLTTGALGEAAFTEFKNFFITITTDVLGILPPEVDEPVIDALLVVYTEAKRTKAYDQIAQLRAVFSAAEVVVMDLPDGRCDWGYIA